MRWALQKRFKAMTLPIHLDGAVSDLFVVVPDIEAGSDTISMDAIICEAYRKEDADLIATLLSNHVAEGAS